MQLHRELFLFFKDSGISNRVTSSIEKRGSLFGIMAENGFSQDRLSDKVDTVAKNNRQAGDHKS